MSNYQHIEHYKAVFQLAESVQPDQQLTGMFSRAEAVRAPIVQLVVDDDHSTQRQVSVEQHNTETSWTYVSSRVNGDAENRRIFGRAEMTQHSTADDDFADLTLRSVAVVFVVTDDETSGRRLDGVTWPHVFRQIDAFQFPAVVKVFL